MAEPRIYLTPAQERLLARMLSDYQAGRLGASRGSGDPLTGWGTIRAKTTTAHAAGATETVTLCKHDWTELTGTGSTVEAINDSQVEIPDDTKLYLAPDAEGRLAILQAFICTE